ncbi:hypothetical protein [Nocardioides caeni]|uniref:Uncharacterized protein n=2 Tax=Nocardioides caeni TaxID=574700 RepID=A0A4S8MZ77_9ACTN|nr:hypothetical protein [Nocardioides caeni]THV08768.1 hypothetical protein E9934_19235 [Nocardioides caeni]
MMLQKWFDVALAQTSSGRPSFMSAHVTDLGLREWDWSTSIALLTRLASTVPDDWFGRVSLALPLQESSKLLVEPPKDLSAAADTHEPPSIYVLAPGFLEQSPTDGEEFRAAVQGPAELAAPGLVFEFVSARNAEARSHRWECVNVLWVHLTPLAKD